MKTSEVFKHAKRHLAKDYTDYICSRTFDQQKFICISIDVAFSQTQRLTVADRDRCLDVIASRLGRHDTLEGWLAAEGCIGKEYNLLDSSTKDRIQKHRHAWLDKLIAEFEAKGD